MSFYRFFLCFTLLITFSGCQFILLRGFLGFDRSPQYLSDKRIEKKTKRRNIPSENALVFKNDGYYKEVRERAKKEIEDIENKADSEDGINSERIRYIERKAKNDLQLVQLRFFKGVDQPIYKSLNCHINPFDFLNPFNRSWNIANTLDSFPPKPLSFLKREMKEDDDLCFFLKHSQSLNGEDVRKEEIPQADYYVVVIWNNIAHKYSRKLIRQTRRYVKKHQDKDIHVFYINNHNAFIWKELEESDKQEILNAD